MLKSKRLKKNKSKYGNSPKSSLFEVVPMMDWSRIVAKKLAVCQYCKDYDSVLGGCKGKMLPTDCRKGEDAKGRESR